MSLIATGNLLSPQDPLEVIENVLLEHDHEYQRLDDELVAELETRWGYARFHMKLDERGETLLSEALYDHRYPIARRAVIEQTINAVNHKLRDCGFGLNEDGALFLQYEIALRRGQLEPATIVTMLEEARVVLEKFYPAFQKIVWGEQRPEQVLEACLFETVAHA